MIKTIPELSENDKPNKSYQDSFEEEKFQINIKKC